MMASPVLLLALAGCQSPGWLTEIPLVKEHVAIRTPAQQRVVSAAADAALEMLDFSPWQGATATVEINGVFPHSERDVLDYLRTGVEARMSAAGVRTLLPDAAGGRPAADLRVVVSVAAAGADEVRQEGVAQAYRGQVVLNVHVLPLASGTGRTLHAEGEQRAVYAGSGQDHFWSSGERFYSSDSQRIAPPQ